VVTRRLLSPATLAPHQHIALLSPAVGTENIGDHFIEQAIVRMLGPGLQLDRYTTRRTLSKDETDRINDADCALICGTNLYQHEWPASVSRRVLKRLKVPVIPIAVGGSAASLGDVRVSRKTKRMIQLLHSKCEVGSVRDPHAAEVVAGADVTNAELTGCAVMQWSLAEDLPRIEPRQRSKLVLTARNWLMHREPYHLDDPTQIDVLREVVGSWDGDVAYAIHEPFDRNIIELLGLSPDQVFDSDDPLEYLELYADPDAVVVGSRLHAGICALAQGVPSVFVGHDTRTYSFCDLMGLGYVELFDASAADQITARVAALAAGDVSEFAALADRYRELRARMRKVFEANDLPVGGLAGKALLA
jgi:polysaccharide pyruvyl transferase WcaK-like protein